MHRWLADGGLRRAPRPEDIPGCRGAGDGGDQQRCHCDASPNPLVTVPGWREFTGQCIGRQRIEIEDQIPHALESLFRNLFKAVAHDSFERWRNADGADKPWRLVVQDCIHRLRRGAPPERREARKHFKQHDPQAEDVGSVVRSQSTRLFRRHVRSGPQHRCGRHAVDGDRRVAGGSRIDNLGQAKVENLDASVSRDEQIVRLDVAMDDPALVSGGQAVRDLDAVVDRRARRQGPAVQVVAKRFAFEQLGHDERSAFVHADIVNRKNIGMIQAGGCAGLTFESPLTNRIAREGRRQHLDGDVAPELRVVSAIDVAHPSGAQLGEDLEPAESMPHRDDHAASIATACRTIS